MSHKSRSFKRKLALFWGLGIACLLLMPGAMVETAWMKSSLRHVLDSIGHGVLFLVLAIFVWQSAGRIKLPGRTGTALVCLAYAAVLEVLQIPIPGRGFEMIDIAAAFLGILAGLVLTASRRFEALESKWQEHESGRP